MYRTYKRKLDLTVAQEKRILNWIGTCRMVYNLGLEVKISAYKTTGKSPSNYDLQKQITDLRKDYNWINDVPYYSLANSMDRLDKAFKAFFKGFGFPKFAKKGNYNSFKICHSIKLNGNKIFIQKIGWLKLFKDSGIVGNIKFVTIKKDLTGFYACITCDLADTIQVNNRSVG